MAGKWQTPQDKHDKKVVSANLNRLLEEKPALTKKDVALAVGIKPNTIYNYFNGATLPSERNSQKLADFFDVPLSQIDPRFSPSTDNSTHVRVGTTNSGTITVNSHGSFTANEIAKKTRDNSTADLVVQQSMESLIQKQNTILENVLDELRIIKDEIRNRE